jgi:DNA-binding MarR family transcriptional regulator
MKVTQTSLASYKVFLHEAELNKPKLHPKQEVMLAAFKKANCRVTDRDLAKFLGWSINTVTPRRGELVKLNLIEEAGLTFDYETNRRAQTWRLKRRADW